MKTLDQVKAGIAIDPSKPGFTTPYNITQPGHYFLTGNIGVTSGDAIDINANGVTLDLNGFTLSSMENSPAGTAIAPNGLDISIRNGHIRGAVTGDGTTYSGNGFRYGIYSTSDQLGVDVDGVTVSGCLRYGIFIQGTVQSCAVTEVGGQGIMANVVRGCTAYLCGDTAITAFGDVSDCAASSYTLSSSRSVIQGNIVTNCYAVNGSSVSGSIGITAGSAINCSVYAVISGIGINASAAKNCSVDMTTGGTAYSSFQTYNIANNGQVYENCRAQLDGGGGTGFYITSGSATNCSVSNSFGQRGTGISAFNSVVTNCVVHSMSTGMSSNGSSRFENCQVQASGATGISLASGDSVNNCTVQGSVGSGIILGNNCVANNCNASANLGDGIATISGCTGSSITNCTACGNGSGGTFDGIHLVGLERSNRIDGNNASNNTGIGIHQEDGPDLIVRNTARNNTSGTNYSPNHGTSVGPIGTPDTATSPWANFQ
ncbi:MAG: right-handed parallel beta-helix repeat-containing protein [Verrucomicrobiota bacterium]|nr:right-handed parallel beta-helix repeat-containing protein [Verrucomicrobiota bacterium]